MIETRYISNKLLFKETSFTHLRFYSLDNPELDTSCYRHFRDFSSSWINTIHLLLRSLSGRNDKQQKIQRLNCFPCYLLPSLPIPPPHFFLPLRQAQSCYCWLHLILCLPEVLQTQTSHRLLLTSFSSSTLTFLDEMSTAFPDTVFSQPLPFSTYSCLKQYYFTSHLFYSLCHQKRSPTGAEIYAYGCTPNSQDGTWQWWALCACCVDYCFSFPTPLRWLKFSSLLMLTVVVIS